MENTTLSLAPNKTEAIPSSIIGMVILLFTELMFFVGLISAYVVKRASAESWPPIGQPRLPIEVTAVNTLFLLASAVTFYLFFKRFFEKTNAKPMLLTTIGLGVLFLLIQGYEWINLLSYGLTSTSSLYGAYFYTIIGVHGFHILIGLTILLVMLKKVTTQSFDEAKGLVYGGSMYWYFVVAVWPFLYFFVYIS